MRKTAPTKSFITKCKKNTSFPYALANFLNQCEGHISYNSIPIFSLNLCKMLSLNMEQLSAYCLQRIPIDFYLDKLRFPIIDYLGNAYSFKILTDLDKYVSSPPHPISEIRYINQFHKYPDDFIQRCQAKRLEGQEYLPAFIKEMIDLAHS